MGKPDSQFAARNRVMTFFRSNRWRLTARWFLFPYLLFLVSAGAVLLLSSDLKELHLQLNRFHSGFFDTFFKYVTHLGDGYTVGIITLLLLLFVELRAGAFIATTSIIDSFLVQFLKRSVFPDHFRPLHYFSTIDQWQTVAGVEQHNNFSFPSGHTAAAFCLYFSLALVLNRKWTSLSFFAIALLVGLSRVYLSQHFLEDIYIGSLIGTSVVALCYPLFYRGTSELESRWGKPLITIK